MTLTLSFFISSPLQKSILIYFGFYLLGENLQGLAEFGHEPVLGLGGLRTLRGHRYGEVYVTYDLCGVRRRQTGLPSPCSSLPSFLFFIFSKIFRTILLLFGKKIIQKIAENKKMPYFCRHSYSLLIIAILLNRSKMPKKRNTYEKV